MGQAFYRQYRSKSFGDVVGQEHVTKTLKQAIKSGRISHAYLFTGPRGVGKTSVARILAYEVNGLDYEDDTLQLDIIEIDAASNRRIDEIRDLRDKVHIAPTSSKYKVYIIDEVHMLTKEAFNALLKTLEEPPKHCIFILATTEAHKVPETITSRTQKFVFKPIGKSLVTSHLAEISKAEKLDITQDALELLAEHGEGSFRDSISMLDQLASSGQKIDSELVRSILGLPQQSQLSSLRQALDEGRGKEVVLALRELGESGVDPVDLAKSLAEDLRQKASENELDDWQIQLLRDLLDIPANNSGSSQRLEVALLQAVHASQPNPSPSSPRDGETKLVGATSQPVVKEDMALSEAPSRPTPRTAGGKDFNLDDWPAVLSAVKSEAASLYTALRLAEPNLSDSTLSLAFQFPLHQKKLNSAKAKDTISGIIQNLTGSKLTLVCVVREITEPDKSEVSSDSPTQTDMQSISNIFGGGEVLESETIR